MTAGGTNTPAELAAEIKRTAEVMLTASAPRGHLLSLCAMVDQLLSHQPAAAPKEEVPSLPEAVIDAIREYGDSRADGEIGSGVRMGNAILAIRRWAKTLSAAPQVAAGLTDEKAWPGYLCERIALTRLRNNISALALHPHKRKVVADWIDDAIAEVEQDARTASSTTPGAKA